MDFRLVIGASIAAAYLVVGTASAQSTGAAVILPGLWEITVQTRSPIAGPPLTHRICIDKDHLMRPELPRARTSDECQVQQDAAAANETAYTVRCPKRQLTSSTRITYSGDHFDGIVLIRSANGDVQQLFTGRRVSDCDDPTDTLPTTSTAH
jgi:hypothetical protein